MNFRQMQIRIFPLFSSFPVSLCSGYVTNTVIFMEIMVFLTLNPYPTLEMTISVLASVHVSLYIFF